MRISLSASTHACRSVALRSVRFVHGQPGGDICCRAALSPQRPQVLSFVSQSSLGWTPTVQAPHGCRIYQRLLGSWVWPVGTLARSAHILPSSRKLSALELKTRCRLSSCLAGTLNRAAATAAEQTGARPRAVRPGQTRPENRPLRFCPAHPLGPQARAPTSGLPGRRSGAAIPSSRLTTSWNCPTNPCNTTTSSCSSASL